MRFAISQPIDKLLNGGIETGCITNFYGPAASGKSNIAMCAVVSVVNMGKRVVYIDTEGGFSSERIEQISKSQARKYTDKIVLLEPKTWQEQSDAIRKVGKILEKENVGLVVADSIVALWRVTIDSKNFQDVNKELATQLSLLSKYAREHNIPVLLTNQVYADIETGKLEMSGRNIVKWWSKNIVELSHAGRTACRIARISRARSQEEDKQIEFQIVNEGLKEVKFKIF